MSEGNNKFFLYEYLLYFWKKKWFFLLVPPIFVVLTLLAINLLIEKPAYTGQANVFTGSLNAKDLTNPLNIAAKFKEVPVLDIYVSEKGNVRFTLAGSNQQEIESKLKSITDSFYQELKTNADQRIQTSEEYLEALETRINSLEKAVSQYQAKVNETKMVDQGLAEILSQTEIELTITAERAYKIKSDLVLFEQPKVLSVNVNPSKTYVKEGIVIGIILGLLSTVALLIFLKYIGDARRNYRHDH